MIRKNIFKKVKSIITIIIINITVSGKR
jgi:hypothetical protein